MAYWALTLHVRSVICTNMSSGCCPPLSMPGIKVLSISYFWEFMFCSVLCLLCFVRVCLYVLFGHLLGKGWPLGSRLWCLLWVCHFPIGILGQVWYLIVSIPDLCTITYFHYFLFLILFLWAKQLMVYYRYAVHYVSFQKGFVLKMYMYQ